MAMKSDGLEVIKELRKEIQITNK